MAIIVGPSGGGVTGLTSVTGTINQIPYFDTATTLAASELERTDANTVTLESTSAHYRLSTDLGFKRGAAGSGYFTDGSTGHATGLGLGTATPLTQGSETLNAAAQIVGTTAALFVSGSTSADWVLFDSNATANQRRFRGRVTGTTATIGRVSDDGTTAVDYLTAALATDVVTLGSASVAGVNYISGTGNHTFSDGNVYFPGGGITGSGGGAGQIGLVGGAGIGIFAVNGLDIGWDNGSSKVFGSSTNFRIPANNSFAWVDNATNAATGTVDLGIERLASGVGGVHTGTAGTTGAWVWARRVVTAASGTTAIDDSQSGGLFVNTGTSGTTTFTLPAAAAGLHYCFVENGDAAGELLINVQTGDNIVGKTDGGATGTGINTAAGTGIKNTAATNAKGDVCMLTAVDSTTWVMTSVAGVWASQ